MSDKIVQITAVVEGYQIGETVEPGTDATVYGLGDDNKMYYWTKKGLRPKDVIYCRGTDRGQNSCEAFVKMQKEGR